jgi:dipeptidyl aminopeptidase/acylaminoacyl peptidase
MITRDFFTRRDLRGEPLYEQSRALARAFHQPGADCPVDALEVSASPCGRWAGLTGVIFRDLDSPPTQRALIVDLASGEMRRLPHAGNSDRCPRWSPDGRWIAFLSDRGEAGNFQLYRIDGEGGGVAVPCPAQPGLVESFSWSPDGRRVLLGVAGFGADLAGCQGGASTFARSADFLPAWVPTIETADAENLWRWACVYDVETGEVRRLSRHGLNVWEASWLGDDRILAVCSPSHAEGAWYSAQLFVLDAFSGAGRLLYVPKDQIGCVAGSPDGRNAALIEAVSSDRQVVHGRLLLIDPASGADRAVDTRGTDVMHAQWHRNGSLAYVGHRSFECVLGNVDAATGVCREEWASAERTMGMWSATLWPLREGGVVAVAEACHVPPELAVIESGRYRVVRSFAADAVRAEGFNESAIEPVRWKARDGLEIHGWIIKPPGPGPFPLVMDVHGGPVGIARNRWIARQPGSKLLVDHGYAYFYPNPRGSSGRGVEFARAVHGDMGGKDMHDLLAGIDHLVATGVADPRRIGVTGISYGGFMSAWMITQDARFAAAVPISPISNWYSQHWASQIPVFDEIFMGESPRTRDGKHFHRSPVVFAHRVTTPVLQLAGQLDKNTPPTQALEFHRALMEQGVETVCVTYPNAGHGIRNSPEAIDHATRKVAWFLLHMPPGGSPA